LAPFYDLVCTRAWPNLDRRLAMDIGGESDPEEIRSEHWARLAREMAMRPRFVVQEVERLAEAIKTILPDTRANLEAEHGPLPMLQQPEKIIRRQLRIARKLVG
jgi:serine/threonine-protein kinase HipA